LDPGGSTANICMGSIALLLLCRCVPPIEVCRLVGGAKAEV
jgi:hypothetical protein